MSAELDVAGNIKAIEKMKSDLLNNVSDLYANMLADTPSDMHSSDDKADLRINNLSEIVILAYKLSSKLGVSYQALDSKIVSKLKLNILDEGGFTEASPLLKYLEKYRR